ncbi:MAG: hypothetical protein ABSA02_20990 [Trebonia sp.]|jgi:hypothetical protein
MYTSYMLYQAERVKTIKEQREEDTLAGQLAAGLGRSRRSTRRHGPRGHRGFRRTAGAARPAPCVPAPRPAFDDHRSRV